MKLRITLEMEVPMRFASDREQADGFEQEIVDKNISLYFTDWEDMIKVNEVVDFEIIGSPYKERP